MKQLFGSVKSVDFRVFRPFVVFSLVIALCMMVGASGCPLLGDSKAKITGQVTDDKGRALPNATVSTVPPTEVVKTDESGYYVITGVDAGNYVMKVSKAGKKSKTQELIIERGTVFSCGGVSKKIDVGLSGDLDESGNAKTGSIEGTVTDAVSGSGIQTATLTTSPATKEASTDTNGKYVIDEVSAGSYTVTATKSGYLSNVSTAVEVKAGEVTTVDIKLTAENKAGSIKGKVTNSAGTAIEGVAIMTNPVTSTKTTDASGNYEITNVSAGDYTVTAVKTGYDTGTKSVTVKVGEQADGNITLNYAYGYEPGTILTIAGTGVAGYSGDGGQATSAQIDRPYKVAIDSSGNIYIAEYYGHRIRKINTSGVISTIAGTGTSGYSGDGGSATSAQLSYPRGVAVDGSGNIYIADLNNDRIRKINISGVITTIVGTGVRGYSGDGGQATSAQLNQPTAVTVDGSGNIYIGDGDNNRTRKINTSGIISTIAGTGTGGYNGDSITATSAQLYNPEKVAIDGSGNIYIADLSSHRIRKINTSGVISTVAGTGTAGFSGDGGQATSAQLYYPTEVEIDISGNIYIADSWNHRTRKIDTSGVISTIAGTGTAGYSGDGGSPTSAQLNDPSGVAIDGSGNIYITDQINHRIRKIIK